MSYKKIDYDVTDNIATIAFNDPETFNSCGMDTAIEILHALENSIDDARCTVLTGRGKSFCSGANLSPGSGRIDTAGYDFKPDAGRSLEVVYNPVVQAIREHPHPVITAVNGAAAGAGCSLGLMGDMVYAAKSAYFLQAFRNIGLVPDAGSSWLLARTVGRVRAMEMTLMGDRLPAEKALEWGLVNYVVEDDELMSTVMEAAKKIATGPTIALALTRKIVWDATEDSLDETLQDERSAQRQAGRTADFAEGVSAFLQKRKAEFQGR